MRLILDRSWFRCCQNRCSERVGINTLTSVMTAEADINFSWQWLHWIPVRWEKYIDESYNRPTLRRLGIHAAFTSVNYADNNDTAAAYEFTTVR